MMYVLIGRWTAALFGGRSTSVTFIKVMSRVLPMVFAPLRIKTAFTLAYAWGEAKAGTFVVPQSPASVGVTSTHDDDGGDAAIPLRCSKGGCQAALGRLFGTRHRETRRTYYKPVPPIGLAVLVVSVFTFSVFTWVRVATWPGCHPEIVEPRACIFPTYPLFDAYGPDAGCACNALVVDQRYNDTESGQGPHKWDKWNQDLMTQLDAITQRPQTIETAIITVTDTESSLVVVSHMRRAYSLSLTLLGESLKVKWMASQTSACFACCGWPT